jgi:hypothetical protein
MYWWEETYDGHAAFQNRNSPGAVDPAAPFRLGQALFQCVHSLLEPLVAGARHGGDAATMPMTGMNTAPASASSSAPPMTSAALPANAIKVCRSHRISRTIGNASEKLIELCAPTFGRLPRCARAALYALRARSRPPFPLAPPRRGDVSALAGDDRFCNRNAAVKPLFFFG